MCEERVTRMSPEFQPRCNNGSPSEVSAAPSQSPNSDDWAARCQQLEEALRRVQAELDQYRTQCSDEIIKLSQQLQQEIAEHQQTAKALQRERDFSACLAE